MIISIKHHITCDFPGGGGLDPLSPHLAPHIIWVRKNLVSMQHNASFNQGTGSMFELSCIGLHILCMPVANALMICADFTEPLLFAYAIRACSIIIAKLDNIFYYIPINDTSFDMCVFWQSDTENQINELRFSDSITLSFKRRLTSVTCFYGNVM